MIPNNPSFKHNQCFDFSSPTIPYHCYNCDRELPASPRGRVKKNENMTKINFLQHLVALAFCATTFSAYSYVIPTFRRKKELRGVSLLFERRIASSTAAFVPPETFTFPLVSKRRPKLFKMGNNNSSFNKSRVSAQNQTYWQRSTLVPPLSHCKVFHVCTEKDGSRGDLPFGHCRF